MILLPVPVLVCDHFLSRARGLLGREQLLERVAVLLAPCRGVHTFGMHAAIDLAFLDQDCRVLEVVPHLQPWRWRKAREDRASLCLEAAPGRFDAWGLREGARLTFFRAGSLS